MLFKLLKGSLGKSLALDRQAQAEAAAAHSIASPLGQPDAAIPFPGAADRSVVIVIFGISRSNPFKSISEWMIRELQARELHCYLMDLSHATWPNAAFDWLYLNNKIRYVVSWGGAGSNVDIDVDGQTRNIWANKGIPVIRMMGDHPAYFLDIHAGTHTNILNVYGFAEHREYYQRRINPLAGYAGVSPICHMEYLPPEEIDFAAKKNGKIFFLKNGNDPVVLLDLWRECLPASTSAALCDMAEDLVAKLQSEDSYLIEATVLAYFTNKNVDISGNTVLVSYYVAQLDDYLRRVKSEMIARSLLDFPIEVHGEHWDHVDFSNRRAKLVPYGDFVRSSQLIRESLCVIDMAPNTFSAPHERFVRSASRHTVCLTNRIPFLSEHFGPLGQPLFEFTPDSIRASVSAILADPEHYVDVGRRVGEAFTELASRQALLAYFDMLAEQVRMEMGDNPDLQPFVVWPPKNFQRGNA